MAPRWRTRAASGYEKSVGMLRRGSRVLVARLPFHGEERIATVRERDAEKLVLDLRDERSTFEVHEGAMLALVTLDENVPVRGRARIRRARRAGERLLIETEPPRTDHGEQRRSEARVSLESAEFEPRRLDLSGAPSFRAYLCDLGAGGVALRTEEPLDIGVPLRFSLALPGSEPLVGLLGTVVSRIPTAAGFRIGVRLERVDADTRGRLRRAVAALDAARAGGTTAL